jgi:hypothetical protein
MLESRLLLLLLLSSDCLGTVKQKMRPGHCRSQRPSCGGPRGAPRPVRWVGGVDWWCGLVVWIGVRWCGHGGHGGEDWWCGLVVDSTSRLRMIIAALVLRWCCRACMVDRSVEALPEPLDL